MFGAASTTTSMERPCAITSLTCASGVARVVTVGANGGLRIEWRLRVRGQLLRGRLVEVDPGDGGDVLKVSVAGQQARLAPPRHGGDHAVNQAARGDPGL